MLKFEEITEIIKKDFKLNDDYYVIKFFMNFQKELIEALENKNIDKLKELREAVLYLKQNNIDTIFGLELNIENSIKFLTGENNKLFWHFNIIDEDENLKSETLYIQDKLVDNNIFYLMRDLILSTYNFKLIKAKDWKEQNSFLDRNIELDKNKIEINIKEFSIKLIELFQYNEKDEIISKIQEMKKELDTIYKYRIISNLLRTEILQRIENVEDCLLNSKDILMWNTLYFNKEYDKLDIHYSKISIKKIKVVEFLQHKLYEIYIKNIEDIIKSEEEFEKIYQDEVCING